MPLNIIPALGVRAWGSGESIPQHGANAKIIDAHGGNSLRSA